MRGKTNFFGVKAIRSLLIGLILMSFASCKKKGEITGKVSNVYNGMPIEGIEFALSSLRNETLFHHEAPKVVAIATSDANGEFKIDATYLNQDKYHYTLAIHDVSAYVTDDTTSEISKQYYCDSGWHGGVHMSQDVKEVKKTKDLQHFEFIIAPMARLKIIAKKVSPFNASDWIIGDVVDENMPGGVMMFYGGRDGFLMPMKDYYQVPTNGTLKLRWKINSNNQETYRYDSISLAQFTKATYTFSY